MNNFLTSILKCDVPIHNFITQSPNWAFVNIFEWLRILPTYLNAVILFINNYLCVYVCVNKYRNDIINNNIHGDVLIYI